MVIITTKCPVCQFELPVAIDESEGPPAEAAAECELCGAIPVFVVETHVHFTLGEVMYDERDQAMQRKARQAGIDEAVARFLAERAQEWAIADNPAQCEAISLKVKERYGEDGPEYDIYMQLAFLRGWEVWTTIEQAVDLVTIDPKG
jgi:hypothetical protein